MLKKNEKSFAGLTKIRSNVGTVDISSVVSVVCNSTMVSSATY